MKEVNIKIPSSIEFVGPIVKFFYAMFEDKEIEETIVTHVVTSVIEAVGNAIMHGNEEDISKEIYILVQINNNKLSIKVRDEGKGFDVDSLPNPLAPENLLNPCGRGILLIKSFMDNVMFDFHDGKGSTIIMEKVFEHDIE